MEYLDVAEELFRDIDAIETRQKYKDALKVQTQRNAAEQFKINNYDRVLREKNILLNENVEEGEMALRIVNIVFEDLKKNGLSSEGAAIPMDPEQARVFAVKRKVIDIFKTGVDVLYRKEFKVELEKTFLQKYQEQKDQIVEIARENFSGTPLEQEIQVRNLIQKIDASIPLDVFKSLQVYWRILCDRCDGSHLHLFTAEDATALLRHSSIKKNTENGQFYFHGFRSPCLTFNPHIQEVYLAPIVRAYINSRLQDQQVMG
jgi:hypothetical protein